MEETEHNKSKTLNPKDTSKGGLEVLLDGLVERTSPKNSQNHKRLTCKNTP